MEVAQPVLPKELAGNGIELRPSRTGGEHCVCKRYMPFHNQGEVAFFLCGLYREGVHGIRCENLVLCRELMETEFGTFLGFEILTLFPFDRSLFDTSIMTEEEVAWVDNYHALVRERLWPALENVLNQMLHSSPIVTSPMTDAFSARKQSRPITGVYPRRCRVPR